MAEVRAIKLGVVIRPEADIKAEALREAADDWYGDDGPWNDHGSEATWLRARAAKLLGTEQETTKVEERPDDDPAPVATCNGRDCGGRPHE